MKKWRWVFRYGFSKPLDQKMNEPVDPNELEWTERLKSGDYEAFGPLLEAKRAQLLAFLKSITGDHLLQVVSIEDLYQDLATSAWSAIPKVAGPEFDPMPWLFQLARRRVSDAHRFHFGAQRRSHQRVVSIDGKRGEESLGLKELLISSITSPSAVVSRNMKLSRVRDTIATMGEEVAEIIRLRFVDGLTTSEIAERLNKSDVSVRVTLSRSLKKLSELLNES